MAWSDEPEIFWWIDWACTNQDDPGPDMAALPAYAAVCNSLVAAWTDVYAGRAWCQVELLMAYAFTTSGRSVLVVPEGFENGETRTLKMTTNDVVTLADPAKGALTNDGDREVIESLTEVARQSTAFSCARIFMKYSAESCVAFNVCFCCQCCGLGYCSLARTVRPGASTVTLQTPAGASLAAPANEQMARGDSSSSAKVVTV